MNGLFLRQADDGKYCLFGWDAKNKTMSLIAEASYAKSLSESWSFYLIGDSDDNLKMYMLLSNELIVVPVHTKNVDFIGRTCVYERAGQWFTFIDGKEILLGRRKKIGLSLRECIAQEVTGFHYFVLGDDDKNVKLSMFNKNELVQIECHHGILPQKEDYLFVKRCDNRFDVFKNGRLFDGDACGAINRYLEDDNQNVYFWHTKTRYWVLLGDRYSHALADNALLVHNSPKSVVLYQVNGVELIEQARGEKVEFTDDGDVVIGGKIYNHDRDLGVIDFAHPKLTKWQSFCNWFK